MSFEQEVADALPDDFGLYGLAKAFNNPLEAFKLLVSNGNGKITKEDLQKLLERFGFNGFAAKITAKLLFNTLDNKLIVSIRIQVQKLNSIDQRITLNHNRDWKISYVRYIAQHILADL
ncbi:unnamed protein product [Rotaria socialis]|uniref:EF-hand domain-containing protein n=2 Tax=Rotaria socialis TaxID=392032 RepID=A0A817WFI3_9BILA|nr:unnamed protein product [Rotaria socialis]CAF4459038.1 unnamed protein product [Rotaria socialis]CAF4540597.1 unnamed protein product [Rotaria socialis]